MESKRIYIIGIATILLIGSLSVGYYFSQDSQSEGDRASYTTVSYNVTIDTEENENYTIYIPVPLHSGKNEAVTQIIDNLTTKGDIDYSVVETDTPLKEQKVLKVDGAGPGKLKFNKTFPQNTSAQRVKYCPYQIVDLSLLHNNSRNCYVYLDNKSSIQLDFNTYYSMVDTEKWKCYWRTDSKIKIDEGWNDVVLNHYMDPD